VLATQKKFSWKNKIRINQFRMRGLKAFFPADIFFSLQDISGHYVKYRFISAGEKILSPGPVPGKSLKQFHTGSCMVNVAPLPGWLSTFMVPL